MDFIISAVKDLAMLFQLCQREVMQHVSKSPILLYIFAGFRISKGKCCLSVYYLEIESYFSLDVIKV
jgi:hypothetical protein